MEVQCAYCKSTWSNPQGCYQKKELETGNLGTGNWNEFTVIIHMRSQMEEKGKEKALLRAFKFTGKQNLILKILSYFDFCIVYNFIKLM